MNENKWLIFVIMAITLAYAVGRKSKQDKKRCIQVVTIVLTCFSGFRSWRMGDVFHYCNAYVGCNLPSWNFRFVENGDTVGLQLFFRTAGQMGISFEVCLFLIAAFVAITLGVLVYRYSPSPYWSYVMYLAIGFYIASFSMLKQIIAMGFIMLAMIAVIERQPGRFLLWVAVAAIFHTPALIFLVAYPFANKRINLSYFLILFSIVAGIFLFRDRIVQWISSVYYDDSIEFEAAEILGGKVVVMVMILLIALIFRPLRNYDTLYCQTFNIMILAAIVQCASVYDNVFTRLADYFYQFVVLFIPLMLQSGWEQAKKYPQHSGVIRYWPPKLMFLVQFGITLFSLWFYMANVNGSSALLKDFHFFWQVDGASSRELLEQALGTFGGY